MLALILAGLGLLAAGLVTARDGDGWAGGPVLQSPPVIAGYSEVGEPHSATPGTWQGTAPLSFEYQWQRCDEDSSSCTDIEAAIMHTYTPSADDVDKHLRVVVTARGAEGSAAASWSFTEWIYDPSLDETGPPFEQPAGGGTRMDTTAEEVVTTLFNPDGSVYARRSFYLDGWLNETSWYFPDGRVFTISP